MAAVEAITFESEQKKLQNVCARLKATIAEFPAARKKDDKKYGHVEGSLRMIFLEMKQLNRELYLLNHDAKDKVQESKGQLDKVNLRLQSLQYEKAHFLKEIYKCRDFPSLEKTITLLPKEEYLEKFPLPPAEDSHTLHLARLNHELQERKRLVADLEDIKQKKKAMVTANSGKKKVLQTLQEKVEQLFAQAQTIEQLLPRAPDLLPIPDTASLLPPPLYNFYHLACAQQLIEPEVLSLSIEGDVDKAKQLASEGSSNSGVTPNILHPLSVVVGIKLELSASTSIAAPTLLLRFSFAMAAKVVLVKITNKNKQLIPHVLTNLFPDDSGEEPPHLATSISTQSTTAVGITTAAVSAVASRTASLEIFRTDGHYPFRWAQSLCGLHFPHPRLPSVTTPSLPYVMRELVLRHYIRENVVRQYVALQKKTLIYVDKQPAKSTIMKWVRLNGNEYAAVIKDGEMCPNRPASSSSSSSGSSGSGSSSSNSSSSSSSSSSGSGTVKWWLKDADYSQLTVGSHNGIFVLECYIVVCADYPVRPPHFRFIFSKSPTETVTIEKEKEALEKEKEEPGEVKEEEKEKEKVNEEDKEKDKDKEKEKEEHAQIKQEGEEKEKEKDGEKKITEENNIASSGRSSSSNNTVTVTVTRSVINDSDIADLEKKVNITFVEENRDKITPAMEAKGKAFLLSSQVRRVLHLLDGFAASFSSTTPVKEEPSAKRTKLVK